MGSRFIASRMRCIMNHADFGVRSYLRSISRAPTPFLLDAISNTTNTQVRIGILVPWKIVPVSTENCLRQARHFHTRRCDAVPVRVLRTRAVLRRSGSTACDRRRNAGRPARRPASAGPQGTCRRRLRWELGRQLREWRVPCTKSTTEMHGFVKSHIAGKRGTPQPGRRGRRRESERRPLPARLVRAAGGAGSVRAEGVGGACHCAPAPAGVVPGPVRADDFWGEASASIHDAMERPEVGDAGAWSGASKGAARSAAAGSAAGGCRVRSRSSSRAWPAAVAGGAGGGRHGLLGGGGRGRFGVAGRGSDSAAGARCGCAEPGGDRAGGARDRVQTSCQRGVGSCAPRAGEDQPSWWRSRRRRLTRACACNRHGVGGSSAPTSEAPSGPASSAPLRLNRPRPPQRLERDACAGVGGFGRRGRRREQSARRAGRPGRSLRSGALRMTRRPATNLQLLDDGGGETRRLSALNIIGPRKRA